MKNLKNLFYMLLVLAVGGFATSCSEDDVDNGSYYEGQGVYFSIDSEVVYELEQGQTSVQVPVYRSKRGADQPYEISVVAQYDEEIFTIPYVASFAAGQTETMLNITFDFDDIEPGYPYDIVLQLFSEETNVSEYGLSVLELLVKYDPWEVLGTGYFRDDMVSTFYKVGLGIGANVGLQTPVEIQRSLVDPTLYRMVEPFSASFFSKIFGIDEILVPMYGLASPEVNYLQFVIREDNSVYFNLVDTNNDGKFEEQLVGVNLDALAGPGLGETYVASYTDEQYQNGSADNYGTYDPATKQITFPMESIVVFCDLGGLEVNNSELTRIVLPGGVWQSPEVTAEFVGLSLSADMSRKVTVKVKMNDDCLYYYYLLVDENITDDQERIEALTAEIVAGDKEEAVKSSVSGELSLSYPRGGNYTLLFVPVGQDEETVGVPYALAFDDLSTELSPSDAEFDIELTTVSTTELNIGITPNSNKISYYFDFMTTEEYEEMMAAADGSFETLLNIYFGDYIEMLNNQTGYIYQLEEVLPMIASKGYDSYDLRRLDSETEYTYFVYPINLKTGMPSGPVVVDTFTTPSTEGGSEAYNQWLGTWKVTSNAAFNLASNQMLSSPKTFEVTFSVKDLDNSYYLDGWDSENIEYGTHIDWDAANAKILFPNNQFFGNYGYYALFSAWATYEFTEVNEETGEEETYTGLEFVYDNENFMESAEQDVCMEGAVAEDGTATVVGLETQLTLPTHYDENGDLVYETFDGKYAGMTVFALDEYGNIMGAYIKGQALSLGDYTLEKVVEEAPEAAPQSFNMSKKLPARLEANLQERVAETPKMQRIREAQANNMVVLR